MNLTRHFYTLVSILLACAVPAFSETVPNPILTPRPEFVADVAEPVLDLNGAWKFHPSPPAEFWALNAASTGAWADIAVPGEWVMQGFTVPEGKAAAYWREVTIPADWAGQTIILRFDTVHSDAQIYVNGTLVGMHAGGFTAFECDATSAMRPGANTIALAVRSDSTSDTLASATRYAAHALGGITRKAYLFAVPKLHIRRFHVATTFDEEYRDATLHVDLAIPNLESSESASAIRFRLLDTDVDQTFILDGAESGAVTRTTLEVAVPQPKKWDPEHPNLYTLECTLLVDGTPTETLVKRIGFRQVEVRGNQLFVNNHPVKLRGINRHEVHPARGRSLTPELWRKDAELFKAANLNYIRTSHYPPAEEFIEACDEIGLFVEEEAPLCWIGHAANAYWKEADYHDDAYRTSIHRSILEMIERDRSHPSVLFWSLANESYWSENFATALERVRSADPSRPTSFHDQAWGVHNSEGSTAEIANQHYPGTSSHWKLDRVDRPLLFGEYAHLCAYNREEIVADPGVRDAWGRAFLAMWEAMYADPGILGGAIWSGVDDVFYLPDGRHVGYGGWGPLDGLRRTKPEYWHIKKTYSPIRLDTDSLKLSTNRVEIPVENRHDFTNLNELRIEWASGDAQGIATADVPPRAKGIAVIQADAPLTDANLELRFLNAQGSLIDRFILPLKPKDVDETRNAGTDTSESPSALSVPSISLTEDADGWTMTQGDIELRLDRATGQIAYIRQRGNDIVTGGPELMILPLRGGPCATEHSKDIPALNDTCTEWKVGRITTAPDDGRATITVRGTYQEARGQYSVILDNTGTISIAYAFKVREKINPRQTGMVLYAPPAFDRIEWERDALWTAYPGDHIGRPSGQAVARTSLISGAETTPWALDANALGTNDFRSSKENIRWAWIGNGDLGIRILSDGSHTVRPFLDGGRVGFLVAGFSTGGGEPFFNSHFAAERKPLKSGDAVTGEIRMILGPSPSRK